MIKRYAHLLLAAFSVLQLTAQPGTLDLSFGTNGIARGPVAGTYGSGQAVAEQTDGKLLVCGSTQSYTLLARFNTNGALDASFGTGGLVLSDPGTSNDYIGSIAVQPDGKIVVAGDKYGSEADLLVMRYLPSGVLDNSFSGDGITSLSESLLGFDGATGLVLQPDGKILVCGEHYIVDSWKIVLARFNADGSPDTGFGTNGVMEDTYSATSSDSPRDIALQADGKIVIAGWSIDANGYRMAIARYNANGTPDNSFGTAGKLALGPGGFGDDRANAVRVLPNGKIIVAGITDDDSGYDLLVLQLTTSGVLDPTFGTNGVRVIPFAADDYTQPSLALQPDGRILIGLDNTIANTPDVKVVRLLPDGSLDNSFGTAGIGTSNASVSDDEYAVRTLFLSDGGIAVAGYVDSPTGSDLALWRFNSGMNVGIEEGTTGEALHLFPNPAADMLHIVTGDQALRELHIIDTHGHTVYAGSGMIKLDIAGFAPGMYSVIAYTKSGTITQRFIKE